jgi:RNA polymerase sigma-70 factor (ECF subfamily)
LNQTKLNREKLSDSEVIADVLKGQTINYEVIIKRYNSTLYRVGRAYGFDHHSCEDLMQESYVDAFKNLGKFEERSSLKTWLVRIMINNCYHAKTSKRQFIDYIDIAENVEKLIPMASLHSNTEKAVINRELARAVEVSLSKIPEIYRIVFTLRELDGLSVSESADLLQISESNVKIRLNRAKKLLQKEMLTMYSLEEVYSFNLVFCDRLTEKTMQEIYSLNAENYHRN